MIDAERIIKLSPDAIRELLDSRRIPTPTKAAPGRRGEERWSFLSTVEVWLPQGTYGETHLLATMHNLSAHGLAMRATRAISTETKIALAIHEPELSCYGDAIVRHCSPASAGYLIGVEFVYEVNGAATGDNGHKLNGKSVHH